jgi:hypothetical protein
MSTIRYQLPDGTVDHNLEKLAEVHRFLDRILARHFLCTLNVYYYHELVMTCISILVIITSSSCFIFNLFLSALLLEVTRTVSVIKSSAVSHKKSSIIITPWDKLPRFLDYLAPLLVILYGGIIPILLLINNIKTR